MKPLKLLKQMELMCCNYAPLLRLLWHYTQALVSATSAGSHRPPFFQDQGACPLQGFRWASEHVTSILTDPPPLAAPPLFLHCKPTHCQGHRISMHERKRTIFSKHEPNVNEKGHRVHGAYTACWVAMLKKGALVCFFARIQYESTRTSCLDISFVIPSVHYMHTVLTC